MSGSVTQRLTSLRTACPVPAKYIATVDTGYIREKCLSVEKAFHLHFEDRKIKSRGEWFRFDFSSPDDKAYFNQGSRDVFSSIFGPDHPWWDIISVDALDEYNRKRRLSFLKMPKRRKYEAKAKREAATRRAWKELA